MGYLDTIYSLTVTKTGRPDRVNETKAAITDAIKEYHTLAFFDKDLQRGLVIIGSKDNGRVNLAELIPGLRKLMWVSDKDGKRINKLPDIQDLTCPGYYMLGSTLYFNPSDYLSEAQLTFCQMPVPENSWIAKIYPEAVATLAAAKVANITGNRALAQALFLEVGSIHPIRTGYKQTIFMENSNYEPDF